MYAASAGLLMYAHSTRARGQSVALSTWKGRQATNRFSTPRAAATALARCAAHIRVGFVAGGIVVDADENVGVGLQPDLQPRFEFIGQRAARRPDGCVASAGEDHLRAALLQHLRRPQSDFQVDFLFLKPIWPNRAAIRAAVAWVEDDAFARERRVVEEAPDFYDQLGPLVMRQVADNGRGLQLHRHADPLRRPLHRLHKPAEPLVRELPHPVVARQAPEEVYLQPRRVEARHDPEGHRPGQLHDQPAADITSSRRHCRQARRSQR